jgi:mRNA-degrading endonuclease RelE of RelBE toxin-antitoxin system
MVGQRTLRVGDYRVLYTVDSTQYRIQVLAIGHRRDIYES